MNSVMGTAICLTVVMTLTAVTDAQSRPDFSGVWMLDAGATPPPRPRPEPPPGAPPLPPMPPMRRPIGTVSLTIKQSPTDLTIEWRLDRDGTETLDTFVYKLDGTESVNKNGAMLQTTTARWDGAALVLTSTVPMDGQTDWRITDVYRIENGKLAIENTTENFRGRFSGKRVYKKQ